MVVFLITLPALGVLHLGMGYTEPWLHPEILSVATTIWQDPGHALHEGFRTIVDTNDIAHRIRHLSSVAEVIDALARPYVSWFLFPHPTLTPTNMLTALLAPVLLHRFLRRTGADALVVAASLSIFISSSGFLSVVLFGFRPAKALTVLFFCAVLFLGQRHEDSRRTSAFLWLVVALFLSFFTDETDLALYGIVALVFWPSVLGRTQRWKDVTFLALPGIFLLVVMWALPALYEWMGWGAKWTFLEDPEKVAVLGHLLTARLYVSAVVQVGRAVLTTVGLRNHSFFPDELPIPEYVGIGVLALGTMGLWWCAMRNPARRRAAWRLAGVFIALVGSGIYTTLLDRYPDEVGPTGREYLGSFTFYYHSFLVVLVVVWLALAWQLVLELLRQNIRAHRAVMVAGVFALGMATASNFVTFHHVNRLAQLVHTVPYTWTQVYKRIAWTRSEVKKIRADRPIVVEFFSEYDRVADEFEKHAYALFGRRWGRTYFFQWFTAYRKTPLMKEHTLEWFLKVHFPWNSFTIRVVHRAAG